MASSSNTSNSTTTQTTTQEEDSSSTTTLKLSLKKEKTRKIQWTEDTVDNEGITTNQDITKNTVLSSF